MEFADRWTRSKEVKLHYLESSRYDGRLTPLVYVPGALNHAEQAVELLEEFKPRKWISMSLRGRGKSDAPISGYSFYNHVHDIESVVMDSKVHEYCLMAYSMGVPYAIEYAAGTPGLKGLILCDYPAAYPFIPKSWAERVLSRSYINQEMVHVVKGIQRESAAINLDQNLTRIEVPVLIIKGGTTESLLTEAETDKYKKLLPNVRAVELAEAGHELWEPNRDVFLNVIKDFLHTLDKL
ncbi:alpha/beta fold hydrolase [Bacillus sp. EB01]|uniref:alpha/beta fold hydrolase n=1 Tax=Bacillus sp. EB01 TaxID=1347086 RepID=UPI0005C628AC|nr:alpha/beta hydrolase [Bacillus sp. EB01]